MPKSSAPSTPLRQQALKLAVITETYTTEQEEQDKRKLAFAWRELDLFSNLKNRNLEVDNDVLANQIAEIQGGNPDLERLEADKGYAVSAKEAADIQSAFTDFWFASPDENKQNQSSDAERRFDEAIKECFPEQDAATSVVEANHKCQALHEIYELLDPLINKSTKPISLFDEPPTKHPTAAQRLLSEDSMRMRFDMAAKRSSKAKKMTLATDAIVLSTDKQLRIVEWNDSMVTRHNRVHPDHPLANDSALHDQLLKLRSTMLSLNEKTR